MKRIFLITLAVLLVFSVSGCKKETSENVLRVGMECAYAPYNWTQSDTSNGAVPIYGSSEYAYGYDVMMAKLIAEKLGYTLEIHRVEWGALPMALQAGTIDCVIAGQSITAERLESVDFTIPYYYASIVVLTDKNSKYANAKGISELSGATATSQINTVWYDSCIPQIKGIQAKPAMEEVPAMLLALNSGVIDIVVTDEPTAKSACFVYTDFKMLDFTGTDDNFEVSEEEINIGISVKKGNDDLCEKINGVLEELGTEAYIDMMDQAIEVQPLSEE